MKHDLIPVLQKAPIIAAVRDFSQLSRALSSPVRVVFLLGGDLFTLPGWVQAAHAARKAVFVHLDLIEGISRDPAGVRLIAKMAAPTGVLSTRVPLIKAADDEGLLTVLRMFMVDSSSMETGVRMVRGCAPTLVEIMPGLVTRAIKLLGQRIAPPVIAGGMLELDRDVRAALEAGALAASTSNEGLWHQEGWQHGREFDNEQPRCWARGADHEHDAQP